MKYGNLEALARLRRVQSLLSGLGSIYVHLNSRHKKTAAFTRPF